jgi:hypothetical protein
MNSFLKFQHSCLAPCWEPILGQDLWAAAEVRRDIFELHSHSPRVFSERKDPIVPLGKHDDLVAGLRQEGAPPALPADEILPEPRRHAVAQDVLDDGHHLAVAGGTVGLRQHHQHTAGRQEMTEVIQPRAGIEPIDLIHQVLPGQTACPSGIVAPGDLPPPPLRQGLRDLVVRWPQGPPSALVGLPAREARGPSLKVLAYVGTSAHTSGWYTTDLLGNPIGRNQQGFRYAVDMGVDVHVKLLCRWMASISFTDSVPE